MLNPGEVHVWRRAAWIAARHRRPPRRKRCAPRGLPLPRCAAAICAPTPPCAPFCPRVTDAPLEFALHEKGKPYLASAPEIRFNLAHSHGMALVAVALDVEVGVDIERMRPLPEYAAIAAALLSRGSARALRRARFFPPLDALRSAAQGTRSGPLRRGRRAPGRLECYGDRGRSQLRRRGCASKAGAKVDHSTTTRIAPWRRGRTRGIIHRIPH